MMQPMPLKPLLIDDATDFERLLLGSAELDVPPMGAASALLDRLGGAPVFSFAEERKKRSTATWVFFIAAALGVAMIVFDRTRQREHVVITHETVPVPTPTNAPAPVSEEPPPQPAAEPSTSASAAPPPRKIIRLVPSASASASARRAATPPVGTAFDKGAAARALGLVEYQSCATADGPTGSGHVSVTFENDGTVSVAKVDDGTFAGTAVGGCIAGKFRAAQVPPFDGSSVRVGKSFTIK